MKHIATFVTLLIFTNISYSAQCNVNGRWYSYDSPQCSPNRSNSTPSSNKNTQSSANSHSRSANPACQVSESKARSDLAAKLSTKYPNSFSTQKMLLDSGMEKFRLLCAIPSEPVSDGVLRKLTSKYYPSFGTIHMLYESNMKAYRELQSGN